MFQVNEVEPLCFWAKLLNEHDIILIHIYNYTVSKQKLVGAFLVQNSLLDMFVDW